MKEQFQLKQGDKVVMHTCMEHDHPDNFGKIWTCKTDSFRHKGHDYDSIFLEGFSGSFSTEFLQKVVLPTDEMERLKARTEESERDSQDWEDEYMSLKRRHEELDREALETHDLLKDSSAEVVRLRKALEGAMNEYTNGQGPNTGVSHRIHKVLKDALGEEVES